MTFKQTRVWMALALAMALGGCDAVSNNPPAAAAQNQAAPAAVAPAPAAVAAKACPSQDFAVFLKAFADDVEVQKAHTQRPLRSETIDANADPEPKPVTAMLDGDALRFPLMPSASQQQAEGLVSSQTELNGDKEVMLVKPDTDYQRSFFFRKDACWTLYRMRDDSL